MKYVIACLAVLGVQQLWGTVHRVSNNSGSSAGFTTIQAAVDAASSGDTLLIEPWLDAGIPVTSDSLRGYASAIIDQPLVILGNGYFQNFLDQNVLHEASRVQRLSVLNSGAGTVIKGIDAAKIQVGGDGCFLAGNHLQHLRLQNVVDCLIEANFIQQGFAGLPAVELNNAASNNLNFNIIETLPGGSSPSEYAIMEQSIGSGNALDHNVFANGLVLLQNAAVTNSIFSFSLLENTFGVLAEYNLFSLTGICTDVTPDGTSNDPTDIINVTSNNLIDQSMSEVFTWATGGAPDQAYELQPGSIAEGTAGDGDNRGAYVSIPEGYKPGGGSGLPQFVQFELGEDDQNTCFVLGSFIALSPDGLNLVEAEYFVNGDQANAFTVSIPVPAPVVTQVLAIDLTSETFGFHQVSVRVQDEDGNWSIPVESVIEKLPPTFAFDLQYLGAFWDEDPGFGEEFFINPASVADDDGDLTNVEFFQQILPPVDFTGGIHQLYYRAFDAQGTPGVTYESNVLLLDDPAPQIAIESLLCFFDTDPGYGEEAFQFTGPTGSFNEIFDVFLPFSALQPGPHTLYMRSRDVDGNYGVTYGTAVFVEELPIQYPISGLEYFWDDDPGYGQGTFIEEPSGDATYWEIFTNMAAASEGLDEGPHTLTVRVLDVEGNWSVSSTRDVEIVDELIVIDLNGDGMIGTSDILEVIGNFGQDPSDPNYAAYDVNFSTEISIDDLLLILGNFGVSVF